MTFPISEKYANEGAFYADKKPETGPAKTALRQQFSDSATAVQRVGSTNSEKFGFSVLSKSHPKIAPPELSTIGLIALLRELQRTNSGSDLTSALANANQISSDLDLRRANELENQATLRAQQADEEKTTQSKKIINWIVGIVGLVAAFVGVIAAAIAISVATGGIGALPAIAMAVAVIGGIMATLNVINLSVQEAKVTRKNVFGEEVPLDLSISGMVESQFEAEVANGTIKVIGFNATSEAPGAITRKQYDKSKSDAIFIANVVVAAVMLIVCIASIAGAFSAGRAALQAGSTIAEKTTEVTTQITQNATRAQFVASAVTTGASVVTAAGSGFNSYLSFVLASARSAKSTTLINEKVIETAIQSLQQRLEASQQHFQSAMNFQETLRTHIADAMDKYFQTTSTIAKNTTV